MLTSVELAASRRVPGGPLALARALLGLALILMSLENLVALYGLSAGKFTYPYFSFVPAPPSWLAGAVFLTGLLSGISIMIGLLSRIMTGLGLLTCVIVLAVDQQTYSNHLLLLTLLLGFLAFAEADRRWGVSTARHKGDGAAPLWPQLLMMTQVSSCYLYAGLSKVQPTFLSGEPLAGWMWLDLPLTAFVALAWLTVVTEVGLAAALWVPKLRVIAAVVGVGLHLSIVLFLSDQTLALAAFALTTLSVYPLFLTRPSLDGLQAAAAIRQQVGGPGA